MIFSAFLFSAIVQAQSTYQSKLDFSFASGFQSSSPKQLSLEEYRSLLPQSELLKQDFLNNGNNYYYDYYYFTAAPLLNFLWSYQIAVNPSFEQRLRIGVTYSGSTSVQSSFTNQTNTPYDTLTSSQTGGQTYVDSVYSEYLNVDYSQDQIGLDISYLLKSNPNARWGFYTGIGAVLGVSVNSEAYLWQNSYSYYTNSTGEFYPYNEDYYDNGKSETYSLGSTFFGQIYLPIGVDFRLSKKNEFWKRMHLYTEMRPNMQIVTVEGLDTSVLLSYGWAAFGVRFEF